MKNGCTDLELGRIDEPSQHFSTLLDVCLEVVLVATMLLAPLLLPAVEQRHISPLLLAATASVGLWILKGLASGDLRYLKTPVNVCLALLLAVAILHVLPLPCPPAPSAKALGAWQSRPDIGALLSAPARSPNVLGHAEARLRAAGFQRFGLNPIGGARAFTVISAMVALCWVIGNAVHGRRRLHRMALAAIVMAAAAGIISLIGAAGPEAVGGRASHFAASPLLLGPVGTSVPILLTGMSLALALLLRLTVMAPRGWGHRSRSRWPHAWRRSGARAIGLVLAIAIFAVCIATSIFRGGPLGSHPVLVMLAVAVTILVAAGASLWGRDISKRRKTLLVSCCLLILAVVAAGFVWSTSPAPADAEQAAGKAGWTGQAARAWLELARQGHHARALFGLGPMSMERLEIMGAVYRPTGPPASPGGSGLLVMLLEVGIAGLAAVAAGTVFLAILLLRALRRPASDNPDAEKVNTGGGFYTALCAGVLGAIAGNLVWMLWTPAPLLPLNLMGLTVAAGLGLAAVRARGAGDTRRTRGLRFGRPWLAMLIGAIAIIAAQGLSDIRPSAGIAAPDKLAHMCAFGLLSLLMCRVLAPHPDVLQRRAGSSHLRWLWRPVLAVVVVTGIGVGLEFAQKHMTERRQFEYVDIVADFLGAAIMAGFWYFIYLARSRRQAVEV